MTEEELPSSKTPSGVLTVPLPGFCYGGMQDCTNKTIGYLVFIRSTKKEDEISTDQINHTQYRQNVFLPWVAETREHYLQREEWKAGDPIDDENIWVGWQDGHGPGLKAIVEKKQMEIEKNLKISSTSMQVVHPVFNSLQMRYSNWRIKLKQQ